VIEQIFFDGVLVEPGDGAQTVGDGGPGAAAGFQVAGEALDVGAACLEQAQVMLLAPAGVLAQRVVTGGGYLDSRVLVWDPDAPGAAGPAELGRHDDDGWVTAATVLPCGQVVTGGIDGEILVWDPDAPGVGPAELGRHPSDVRVAALPDGRVVTGADDGRVLIWDPGAPGADPAGLGLHNSEVQAVAVLPSGQLVTGGRDRRVLLWDPAQAALDLTQVNCSVTALATAALGPARSYLAIAHQGQGFSLWANVG
jgi:WD40 repeat protein